MPITVLPRRLIAALLLIIAGAVGADRYSDAWGPAVGEPLPLLAASDQAGTPRTLADLAGRRGLLLFMNRSTEW